MTALLPDLARRGSGPELMDDERVPFEDFARCLADLAWLNRLTLAYRPTERWVATALARAPRRRLTLLDVGSGYGDMLRRLARRFGDRLELVGVDLNPWSARAARAAAPEAPIRYETADIFELAAERRFDLVVSALFTHHLGDTEVVRFLAWMEARAELGWFISDLHRHALPWLFLRLLPRAVPLDRMVAHDGPVSVTRAFRRRDWTRLLAEAGIAPGAAAIRWEVPFRYTVSRWR
jgi:2-polyprenyl-3-methyl-5-hydroxy-6-metoxy-1,4-benzoquinol methylase